MNTATHIAPSKADIYPDSDGKPMADNTLQFQWIVTIQGGLDALYAHDLTVFVAGDLLWYPVKGDPKICQAPDILVAFGRPKGYRGSYKQFEEEGIPPRVVFEILSPNNTFGEMLRKLQFYERYGVEEYYQYDPDHNELLGWLRKHDKLQEIPQMQGWTSPLLKIHFEILDGDLQITGPDGRRFATYVELVSQREQAEREKEQAEREKEQAEREKEQAQQMVEKLQSQLRALGANPEI